MFFCQKCFIFTFSLNWISDFGENSNDDIECIFFNELERVLSGTK